MKKRLLTVLSLVLVLSTLSFAQTLKMGTYGVSPRDVAADEADIFDIAYNGLVNVGVNSQMYFYAVVGDLLDDEDNVIAAGNLANLVWSLAQQPLTSAAALGATADLDDATQVIVFTPDVTGTYVIEITDGVNILSVTVNAGTFIGIEDGNCGLCHSDYVAAWEETGHYEIFEHAMDGTLSDHYASYCVPCHTTGYDTNADSEGFDDRDWVYPAELDAETWDELLVSSPSAMKLARIQCESCHGPGAGHGGATSMDVTLDSKNCAWCHDSGTHHVYPAQWEYAGHDATEFDGTGFHGGHAIGAFVDYAGGRANCSHCHSGSAFVEWVKGGKVTLTEAPTPTVISCAGCHDPHANENSYQLRTLETTLGDGTVVDEATYGTGALCMNCHKSRRYAAEYAVDPNNASSHFGPHHGPQADMLLGANGPDFGEALPTSPHGAAVENACVGCHMFGDHLVDDEGNVLLVGGHSFNMADAEGNDNVEACADCHGEMASFDAKKYYLNGDADLDGDGTDEGLQDEVKGLMEQLAALLPQDSTGAVDLSDKTMSVDMILAGYCYMWVYEDRSFGIHNPAYTVALLAKGIEHAGGTTDIDFPDDINVPVEFSLAQNYPNPFNPSTNIQFTIPEAGNVRITVYDTIGREVAVLIDREMNAGSHEVTFEAANMSTGIYFYKMQSNNFVTVKKMMLMK